MTASGLIRIGLAGDTMLGRGVAERLARDPPESLFSPEVTALTNEADLLVLNLECCISSRGTPWPAPGKAFFFRAPPVAVESLQVLGVDCVTLANNHALDYGEEALLDSLRHLEEAGIRTAGAGADVEGARAPAVLEANGFRLAVVGLTDHPMDFAANEERAGVAFADLRSGVPPWVAGTIGGGNADAVLVSPHWGPNMASEPVGHVRAAAPRLVEAGATLVAGHSAHVFQGIEGRILYDLGDFIDDYLTDPVLRNDLGLLYLVALERSGPVRLEAVPLKLDYCYTHLATGDEAAWIRERFKLACAALGTDVEEEPDRLVVNWR